MRTAKCLIIVLALIAATTGTSQEPPEGRDARCIVRIAADPSVIPLNPQTVNHLVQSSNVAGKAVRDILGAEAILNERNGDLRIEWLSQSIQSIGQQPAPARPRSAGEHMGQAQWMEMMREMEELDSDPPIEPMVGSPAEIGRSEQTPRARGRGDRRSTKSRGKSDPNSGGRSDPNSMMMGGAYGMMGGMGGMMGGGGTGGMMGGGMGMGGYGMGGGAMGGMYGGPAQAAPGGTRQTVTLRLSVHLPENVKPAAQEFLSAVVQNLERTLRYAYEAYEGHIAETLDYKEHQRNTAQERLEQVIGNRRERTVEGNRLEETLQTVVDLSMLSPEMPFSEAIEHIKSAVEPPLPIVVIWKELLDSCEIEPTTPIDMDGLPTVKLETALRMLVAAVGSGFGNVSYQIDDDVIVIREEEALIPQPMPAKANLATDMRDLTAQRRDLARRLRQAEMYLATAQARQRAIEDQIARISHEADAMMKEDSIAREMEKLIEMNQKQVNRFTVAGGTKREELAQARESLVQAKISLARRWEELSKSAGGGQLNEYNSELSRMAIDTVEKKAEIGILRHELSKTEDEIARASVFDPKAARIRMAQEALNIAETQVTRLRAQLAGLQPPTVTMIGIN